MSVNIQDDLTALSRHDKKLLLLRVLGIDEEDIRKVSVGEKELGDVLKVRIDTIMADPDDTSQAAIVCQNIRRAGYSFDTLEPDEFLAHARELKLTGSSQIYSAHSTHSTQSTQSAHGANEGFNYSAGSSSGSVLPFPLRRTLARIIDLTFGFVIANLIIRPVFGINPNAALFQIPILAYLSYAGMLLSEPVFLHFFGTTPGKFIFGISITYKDGSKLSFTDGYKRVLSFFIRGLGLLLPIYTLFTTIRTMVSCKKGQELPWDKGYKLSCSGEKVIIRYFACVIVFIGLSWIDEFFGYAFATMPNTGILTEAEFNENCAKIIRYNCLTSDPDVEYKLELDSQGYVSGVSFSVDTEVSPYSLNPYYSDMYVLFDALVGASDDASFWELSYGDVLNSLADPDSFSFTYAGYEITSEVTRQNSAIKTEEELILYAYAGMGTADSSVPYKQVFRISRIGAK